VALTFGDVPNTVVGLLVIHERRWFMRLPPEVLFLMSDSDFLIELSDGRDLLMDAYWDVVQEMADHKRRLLWTKRCLLADTPAESVLRAIANSQVTTVEDLEEYLRALVRLGDVLMELPEPRYVMRLEGREAQLLVGQELQEYAEIGSFIPVSVLSQEQLKGVVGQFV
jgi:hypothetical protein